jgi:copper(I)-binding protein
MMKTLLCAAVLICAASASAAPALAGPSPAKAPAQASGVAVVQPWSRPAAAGGTAAGFMTLVNNGRPDALTAASSPWAERVEMHASAMTGGAMRMTAEPRTPLAARAQVGFAPGGRHLMFVGLKRPLRIGDRLPATLSFASGARIKVEFVVTPTAPQPGPAHAH